MISVLILSGLWQLKHMKAVRAGAKAPCRQIVKSPWQKCEAPSVKGVSQPFKVSERNVWIREPNEGNERWSVPA
jgi:hypothetical protein